MTKSDEMIPADVSLAWQPPVDILIDGRRLTVSGPADAMHWLLNAWPARDGQRHEVARSVCIETLAGLNSTSRSRDAFKAACEEAGILL
jgi:hypothetical protein